MVTKEISSVAKEKASVTKENPLLLTKESEIFWDNPPPILAHAQHRLFRLIKNL